MACHGIDFTGSIWWNYLDFGNMGVDKTLEGLDVVCTGEVTISIGYDQADTSLATPGYTVNGDTLPEVGMIPIPAIAPSFQIRLDFSANQAWAWEATNVYISQGVNP